MRRLRVIIALLALFAVQPGILGASQVPAGPPYQAGTHPNPIVTFVTDEDFVPSTYDQAREKADVDLMGLSSSEGTRESVSITDSFVEEIKILRSDTDVLFYPVIRQTFRLVDGETLVLYSFRDPSPTGIRRDLLEEVLNQHAFTVTDKPEEDRFGDSPPEQLQIRGSAALLFDHTESSGELTLFWQDERASHVATASVSRERLFRIVADLL
jgi:hypothetical protein